MRKIHFFYTASLLLFLNRHLPFFTHKHCVFYCFCLHLHLAKLFHISAQYRHRLSCITIFMKHLIVLVFLTLKQQHSLFQNRSYLSLFLARLSLRGLLSVAAIKSIFKLCCNSSFIFSIKLTSFTFFNYHPLFYKFCTRNARKTRNFFIPCLSFCY